MVLTKKQLAERKVGGSDAPVLMHGEHFGKTVYDLWAEKAGHQDPEDLRDVLRVQMGNTTEGLNRKWYTKETGNKVLTVKDTLVHPDYDFMTAHLDGKIEIRVDELIEEVVWEGKHITAWTRTDPVETYYPQLQHLMAVLFARRAHLSVLKDNCDWAYYEVERNDDYIKMLIEREEAFWFSVEMDTPPPGWGPVEMPSVQATQSVDMAGNNRWASAAVDWLETRDAAKKFSKAADNIKALVGDDVVVAHGHGIKVARSKAGLKIEEM